MVRERGETRPRVLDIAERLLMQRGYHAFSFGDIAEELGIKSAAIHYHFASKAELVVAVVAAYRARFDAWAGNLQDLSPGMKLTSYFEVGRLVVWDGRVCALGMLTAQLDTVPVEVQVAVVAAQVHMLRFYVENLEAARASGEVSFVGSAEDKGEELACALVGAQAMARALGKKSYVRVMRQKSVELGLPTVWPALVLLGGA